MKERAEHNPAEQGQRSSNMKRLFALFGWTRSSSVLLGGFFVVIFLIIYVWWPLAEQVLSVIDWHGPWWRYMDWLLLGIFAFMSLTIVAHADLRRDLLIVFVGMIGGLVIESWGTQTNLWFYYTAERPPLWIIPAWPIASLSIDRLARLLGWGVDRLRTRWSASHNKGTSGSSGFSADKLFRILYWTILPAFYILMLVFVAPTFDKSFTLMALLLCAMLIATPTNHRYAVLTFIAGSALGYFLERWGTTRQCWTYYTYQTPPFFAVLAHGMAALAFWRAGLLVKFLWEKVTEPWRRALGKARGQG
jgi:hypothetical protein